MNNTGSRIQHILPIKFEATGAILVLQVQCALRVWSIFVATSELYINWKDNFAAMFEGKLNAAIEGMEAKIHHSFKVCFRT